MHPSFFDTSRQVDYQILKDGCFWTEAWYLGHDGDCHVFVNSGGGNVKHYLRDLDDYAFAQSIL